MTRALACLTLLAALGAPLSSLAQAPDVEQAKGYFKAGAAAYEMGDYLAAIQALDAAFDLSPLPAIAFSLAQAERRQYFVSRERAHIDRALELFRLYLAQVPSGGRRMDATDALAQLEPLALTATGDGSQPSAAGPRTRVMISSATPGARVALDGAADQPAPLIAQVTPGTHQLLVSAPGFYPVERTIDAIDGEFVPIEVALKEEPAVVDVQVTPGARVYVDGTPVGNVLDRRRFQLPAGTHRFSFAQEGHRVETVQTDLLPGSTRTVTATLRQTAQRNAAIALLAVSGASLGTGVVLTALTLAHEHEAQMILRRREMGNISAADLDAYEGEVTARDRFRVSAVTGLTVSVATFVTGILLFLLDEPELGESNDIERSSEIRVGVGELGLSGRF